VNRESIYRAIDAEREYQDGKWGTKFDDLNTANDWVAYIALYLGKAVTLPWNKEAYSLALVKVAALCVAALETLERNAGYPPRHYDTVESE
jgi:hypothetical protein